MQALILLISIPAILYSIILHEIAHGYAAYLLGDNTAKNSGRLSLNPIRHIDPFGTVLLPILILLSTGGRMVFGYAKPVPINPGYFKHAERGMMITGAAGPFTNIAIGSFFGFILKTGVISGVGTLFLFYIVLFNFFLAFLNLIPIPPLDGSRILAFFLPSRMKYSYYQLERFGFFILLFLLFFARHQLFAIINLFLEPVLRFFSL